MSVDNPLWGAPRVHGELLKLGIDVSQATVGRYLPRRPRAPSPTWRSFLRNHMTVIVAVDMFVVATATFRLLYAVIVLDHHRRRVVHFEVTQNPTQVWLAQQITEAFPWDTGSRYLLRDRDTSYGLCFQNRVQAMGIEEVLTAPRSPWQSPYVERIIGSIRRECLDHVIIFNETHLRRVLSCYFRYYHKSRTHLSLNKDCPDSRRIQPPSAGKIVAFPEVGGIHYRSNVARPEPRQSIGRGCVSEIRPFRGAHSTSGASKSRPAGSIVADERTPRSDRFVSKDKSSPKEFHLRPTLPAIARHSRSRGQGIRREQTDRRIARLGLERRPRKF